MRVFRPLNLLIVAVLQLLTYYFLDFDVTNRTWLNPEIWMLIASSVLVCAAGYLINDWFDIDADRINKPHKLYADGWSKTAVWTTYSVFNAIALLLLFLIDPMLMSWFIGVIALLLIYSLWLKRLPLIGNFAVSMLAAFSVYVVFMAFETQSRNLVIFFASFAALLTYVRELVKDMEDLDGDAQVGYKTFPVIAGIRQAKSVANLTSVFILVAYTNLMLQWVIPSFGTPVKYVVIAYQVLCVVVPILALIYFIMKAKHKDDFRRISLLTKYIMATGMASMLFF
ncbi:MAG: geranylgeranylglycerol-phosphate geranylgeranyltransferase [Bacteroidia bacterium]|nr:geranylgeranylglycerol-phosphate geranylgeranyltransferase [Bacteroidia bacterium]